MKHSFFEELLLERDAHLGEPLTTQETADLQQHLQSCESCRQLADSLREMDYHLRQAPLQAPQPGFTERWQARLQTDRQLRYRRQSLLLLAAGMAGAVLLVGLLLLLSSPWLRSPEALWWAWVYRMFNLFSLAQEARDFLGVALRASVSAIPAVAWVFLVGLLTELGVLWVVSFRLITIPRRVR